MENISNNYIEEAIETLADSIGIKDNVDDQKIISLIRQKKVKEGIKEIAKCLELPIEISLSYVPKGYHPGTTNNFQSTHLVKTDWRGRGSEGITAQVFIPGYLPMYGTSGLNNFSISVRVSENCADSPATFIAIMAHELSHIVLHSLWHKEKDNEIYTDITAMMLGFSNIIKNGRKVIKTSTSTDYGFFSNTTTTTTEATTYGYLSDDNFNFAFNKIAEILNRYKQGKNKLIGKIKELTKKVKKNRKTMLYFQKYLEYVDKNLSRKMSQKDGYKISTFHQAGYTDEFEQAIRKTENELKQFNNFVQNLNHYSENIFGTIKQYEEKIRVAGNDLNEKHERLKADVGVLKRHVSFGYKLKIFAGINFGNRLK
ncbi:MAG TPA: hypothetical protein PK903_08310 [Paludibacteraceae bacterium]|jgi:uncharacterized protein YeeX (DUF496 family)|nr:hypothetical protein [Candidatus Pacearchaeota archaeon]HOH56090.1 hypothetical protein [Paludibacteraceae bacterium]HQO11433.1 hypothetical protein [bacterium]